jgi:hypothetical protein
MHFRINVLGRKVPLRKTFFPILLHISGGYPEGEHGADHEVGLPELLEELDAEEAAELSEEVDLWLRKLVRTHSRDSPSASAYFSGTMEREATSLFCC